jgi:YD repeat-containing protein
MAGERCSLCGSTSVPLRPEVKASGSEWVKPLLIGFGVFVVVFVALLVFLGYRMMERVKDQVAWLRAHPRSNQPLFSAVPPRHEGPVARAEELKGSGRIYLVQLGPHKAAYSLDEFALWLRSKYSLDVAVLPAMDLEPSTFDSSRAGSSRASKGQYVAELICQQVKRKHPELAADKSAYIIGITEAEMYSVYYKWDSTFSQRDGDRAAIISVAGMQDSGWEQAREKADVANEHLQARLRRFLIKDIAVLYWHLPLNDDPTSLLRQTLYPDVAADDIYESDLDPARTHWGESMSEPCILLAYSTKDGVSTSSGAPIHECWSQNPPMFDESLEMFQVDLGAGLLIDRHTDFDLPDTIPIQFQRVTRDGWSGVNPFGISGTDNYDEFLESADNVTITVIHADAGRDNVVREPRWLPILPLVKYVDTAFSGKFYEMRWHSSPFEHYDLKRFDGEVKTYLPCDSPKVLCYLTGYRNAQGQELKFERDGSRSLVRLTSPNKSWLRLIYGAGGIYEIDDSRGRMVRYGYDSLNRMVSVTYPDGEIFHYEYDSLQHLLTFSVAPDAGTAPRVILRNEFAMGRIVRQTLEDGSTYDYSYESARDGSISVANVRTPDGRGFKIDFAGGDSTVHEQMAAGK